MMSTRQVCERFACGREGEAPSLYSQNRPGDYTVLRSYATPIAVKRGDRVVFTTERHSQTTTRHYTVALSICNELVSDVVVDAAEFEELLDLAGVYERGRAS